MVAGPVVVYSEREPAWLATHEAVALGQVARVVAGATGRAWGGFWHSPPSPARPAFVIPHETLLAAVARQLGIERPTDFLGGIVPAAVARTKAIVHPVVGPAAARPEGWPETFAAAVSHAALPGLTAFSRPDAEAAAWRLLPHGAVRVKRTLATGGRHQRVITDGRALAAAVAAIDDDELARFGVVLEMNLERVTTWSVGQMSIGDLTLSYHGVQRETTDNEGRTVYGGSDLVCVRGGWEELAAAGATPELRAAVEQARLYDRAAHEHVGVVTSRRNYDVGRGLDARGHWRAGVFEHSWRVGGATPAEVAAFEAFHRDPQMRQVHARTVERYGRGVTVPRGARVHFDGDDAYVGPITRYTVVDHEARRAA